MANIRATAKKEGDHYILNGEKKWISAGFYADYFTVLARRMKLSGSWCAGTSMVLFEDVKVPADRMIGKEGTGFKQIMFNFNHERWLIAVSTIRRSRMLLAECLKYASKRKTFGKTLLEHQVIRQKLADMAMRIEACHAMIESVTYQMQQGLPNEKIGGTCAMLKVFATRTFELCVRESGQIFGCASYVRGGTGTIVERLGREVRSLPIPGGSDEILADLAIRQAMGLTRKVLQSAEPATKL